MFGVLNFHLNISDIVKNKSEEMDWVEGGYFFTLLAIGYSVGL